MSVGFKNYTSAVGAVCKLEPMEQERTEASAVAVAEWLRWCNRHDHWSGNCSRWLSICSRQQ
jgi:hypothetical protein